MTIQIDIDDSAANAACANIQANFYWSELSNDQVAAKIKQMFVDQLGAWIVAGAEKLDAQQRATELQDSVISKIT